MIYARVYGFLVLLCGLCGTTQADNPQCIGSTDANGIKLHFAPVFQKDKGWQIREDDTKRYKSGVWLALACKSKQCRLIQINMKAETLHPKDDYYGCLIYQTLNWDLSVLDKEERAVMLFLPDPALKEGSVTTWYLSEFYNPNYRFVPFFQRDSHVEVSLNIPTATAELPNRITTISTRRVISQNCTEQQESSQECMRETVRIHLRENSLNQWLTKPWKGSPETAFCMLGAVDYETYFHRDYLLWVGDIDGDKNPDYLLRNDDIDIDGYALFLSSKAGPQQLVGKAGFHETRMQCD